MTATPPTVITEIDFTSDLSAGLAYYEKVLADGPYLYYRLKETTGTAATDASGNGITGTYAGSYTLNLTPSPVTGESAARFIDLNAGGQVGYPAPPPTTPRVTLEAWVYRSSLDGSASTFYRIGEGDILGGADWMSFSILGNGKLNMASGWGNATTSTAPISAATWYHVACVMDVENNTILFYVNGVVLTTTWEMPTGPGVGFQRGSVTWYWGANDASRTPVSRLAEPAVYTDALQQATIADHYGAAATTPFSNYIWTDVSAYVMSNDGVSRSFGRQEDLQDVTPMEVSYTLRSDDRRYEPENTASPHYPNVVSGRPTRVRMTQDAVTHDWAFGFIDDFPQNWDATVKHCRVSIVAHCFLAKMNEADTGSRTFSEQLSDGRLTALLNVAGQPSLRRTLDSGANTLMAQTVESGTLGEHARAVARSDRGLFFFDQAGWAIFQNGSHRAAAARSTVSRGTLGSLGGEIPYRSPDFHAPKSMIRNVITLRRPGGVDQTVVDPVSRAKHGPLSYTDELLLATDAALATRAAALLAEYKAPSLRIRAVTFNPQTPPGFWVHALDVEPSDLYVWQFRPGSGSSVARNVLVEGVTDSYRDGEYLATWFLSVAGAAAGGGTYGSGTYGSGTYGTP